VYGDSKVIPKRKLLVELELTDGQAMSGHLFVGQQQRLSDLMNDERIFLPFASLDGTVTIAHKSGIRRVRPIDHVATASEGDDPFTILGLSEKATEAEIKQAYHRKAQELHPDRLAALGVAPELVRFASDRLARINEALSKIKRKRQAAE